MDRRHTPRRVPAGSQNGSAVRSGPHALPYFLTNAITNKKVGGESGEIAPQTTHGPIASQ